MTLQNILVIQDMILDGWPAGVSMPGQLLQSPISFSFLLYSYTSPSYHYQLSVRSLLVAILLLHFIPISSELTALFPEYSPQNIPLYYLTFYRLLLLSILFVMLPTINTYKPHSSFLSFPMLVYLVLLAPIDPLVISSRFRQVFALLLSRHFLFETLNP